MALHCNFLFTCHSLQQTRISGAVGGGEDGGGGCGLSLLNPQALHSLPKGTDGQMNDDYHTFSL